jgi:hypothetical protein
MPDVDLPFNLVFMGRYDLTHTSWLLNLLQSVMIFVLETLMAFTSPHPMSRNQVVRLQLVLPVVAFVVFMFMPAGKKLFVITTLAFSIVLNLVRAIQTRFEMYKEKVAQQEAAGDPAEKVVVDVK